MIKLDDAQDIDEGMAVVKAKGGEAESLRRWEDVIHKHEADFWKVGEALINIRVNELWREEFSGKPYESWDDYLEKAWGYVSKAKQFMRAAKLHDTLADAGMSDEEFRRIVPNETQVRKLSRANSLNKEQAKKFVEAIAKEGEKADIGVAAKTLNEIKPPKEKPSPAKLPPAERKKSLVTALDKVKVAFQSKIDSVFDEFDDPETVDAWLRKFAEDILKKLSR